MALPPKRRAINLTHTVYCINGPWRGKHITVQGPSYFCKNATHVLKIKGQNGHYTNKGEWILLKGV